MRQEDRIDLALRLILSDLFRLHYWNHMKYDTDTSKLNEVTRLHEMSMRVALAHMDKYKPLFPERDWELIERQITADARVAYLAYKDVAEMHDGRGEG